MMAKKEDGHINEQMCRGVLAPQRGVTFRGAPERNILNSAEQSWNAAEQQYPPKSERNGEGVLMG